MRIFTTYAFLFIILGIAISCSAKKEEKTQKHLIVYGASDCHVCIDFKKKLDSANVEYEFRDLLLTDKKYDEEMLKKLNDVGYRGYIRYPVVDIEGRMMVKPGFEYVYQALF